MSQDSETISLDLANDLSQVEENETQHKEHRQMTDSPKIKR